VRKILGKHEIAAAQATAIDHAAGISVSHPVVPLVRRMDRLGLAVCSLDDVAGPKRMGAALTYARRYALFALVGIAGEDSRRR
jgi:ERF superfamily